MGWSNEDTTRSSWPLSKTSHGMRSAALSSRQRQTNGESGCRPMLPYFAVLTVQDETKAKQCRAAIEHTVKLGAELNARVIVAHLGAMRDENS